MHLNTNTEILRGLQILQSTVNDAEEVLHSKKWECADNDMEICMSRFRIHLEWAQKSLDWAKNISVLVKF